MTLYGWDASHFDGQLSLAILQRARSEGITFFTHKIAESLQDTEGTLDDTALAAARDAGIPFLGGYLIPRTNATPAAQVARWVQLADIGEGWWRGFPGWFWQVDLERWSYDNVPASVGIDCARRLRDATGRRVILYASRGQYGDQLTGWDGPLWNANYNAGPAYPGDGWLPGWAPYSGRAPAILQYTSSATIAGLSTCDKNAFRGSLADFAAMIGGQKSMAGILDDPQNADALAWRAELLQSGAKTIQGGPAAGQPAWLPVTLEAVKAQAEANGAGLTEVKAALHDLAVPVALTDEDRAALLAGLADIFAKSDAMIGAKLDEILRRLGAAGDALNG